MSERVYSVADITAEVREHLEDRFHGIWVEGEISNLRKPASGHQYFTLKDAFAQLSCVLFKGAAAKNPVAIADGMQVRAFGNVSVYEARGQYQLIAQTVQPKGYGDLQAKFDALKRKLEAEGLFDPERKKTLPAFPRTIGIVTSSTGAAIRDILNVLRRRAPWVRVLVQPVRVQGEGAAEEIAEGIRELDRAEGFPRPDLVMVARGGGSLEDLWAFNEEVVARAIAACELPVLSGVGHEIDFTIADFVADRREPTPSAAAENATPDGATLHRHLDTLRTALDSRVETATNRQRTRIDALRRELTAREPGRRIQSWAQSLDYLGERLDSLVEARLETARGEVRSLGRLLGTVQPERDVQRARELVGQLVERLEQAGARTLDERRRRMDHLGGLMHSLSPDATLKRGFSLTLDPEGRVIKTAAEVKRGDRLRTRFADGEVDSVAE